jgi:peptidoglycan/LPS O-acetylase OafA/YrhL
VQPSANLDFLRAIAVLTVMLDHLIPTMVRHGISVPGGIQRLTEHIGHAGVLAFFVHTSLVLMFSLERLSRESEHRLILRFYSRRAFRIYPLAALVIVFVLVLGLPQATWRATPDPEPSLTVIIANLLLLQNLITGQSVLVPLWSLPYEVEMYLLLPFLFFLASGRHGIRVVVGLLISSWLAGHAVHVFADGRMNLLAYIPCFLCGVLSYALRARMRRRFSGAAWVAFTLGLVTAFCVIHMLIQPQMYWFAWGYALILGLAINGFGEIQSIWLKWLSLRVATYSYGLYLLHVPALYVVYLIWMPDSVAAGIAAFFALSLVGAIAVFHTVEAPMIGLGRWVTERRRNA